MKIQSIEIKKVEQGCQINIGVYFHTGESVEQEDIVRLHDAFMELQERLEKKTKTSDTTSEDSAPTKPRIRKKLRSSSKKKSKVSPVKKKRSKISEDLDDDIPF